MVHSAASVVVYELPDADGVLPGERACFVYHGSVTVGHPPPRYPRCRKNAPSPTYVPPQRCHSMSQPNKNILVQPLLAVKVVSTLDKV